MTISIHAPLAGCDLRRDDVVNLHHLFQSTHPLRGATLTVNSSLERRQNFNPRTPCGVRRLRPAALSARRYFNPRTPCGVRHFTIRNLSQTEDISIHAPLAGCDVAGSSVMADGVAFQSTHPLRGATKDLGFVGRVGEFQSTHPLRGATTSTRRSLMHSLDFNPRTPCGVRLRAVPRAAVIGAFQSTHPLRGATAVSEEGVISWTFQSTHPLRGATAKTYKENCTFLN